MRPTFLAVCFFLTLPIMSTAAPSTRPRPNPSSWVVVASVKSDALTNATLALARASIPAVFQGRPNLQLYVHPSDQKRALATLRQDAKAKHYQIRFLAATDP